MSTESTCYPDTWNVLGNAYFIYCDVCRNWYLIVRNETFTASVGIYQFGGSQTSSNPIQHNPYCYKHTRRPFHFPLMHLIWLDNYSSENMVGNLIRMNISADYFISTIGDLPTGYAQSNTTKVRLQ